MRQGAAVGNLHENSPNGQLKVFWPIYVAAAHMPQVQITGTRFEEGRRMGIDLTKKYEGEIFKRFYHGLIMSVFWQLQVGGRTLGEPPGQRAAL